jgi:UDP-4-amino-4,6-dideoxy-N-acetyl-beta-L-altrosamine transaminase
MTSPQSQPFLPYGRQAIDEEDVAAVGRVLRGDWLTTGPMVDEFEAALAREVGASHAVVCNSGTAALYLAARASCLAPGDAVIVPTITFLASASANALAGLEIVFADVDPETGLMTVAHAEEALHRGGDRIKAICPVHLGGRVDDPAALHAFAEARGLAVIEDACHALGTRYGNTSQQVGGCSHSLAACFSFHPVKSLAMGEGGAVTTNSHELAEHARRLRNHGMTRDPAAMVDETSAFDRSGEINPWYYEASEISHNFRASDINCALGLSQLKKLGAMLDARRKLMARYQQRLAALAPTVQLVSASAGTAPGWHLCAVLIDFDALGVSRATLMRRLKSVGIGSQVHYIPVHTQPYYRERYGAIDLAGAMSYYRRTLSLPLFSSMTMDDVDRVADALVEQLDIHLN